MMSFTLPLFLLLPGDDPDCDETSHPGPNPSPSTLLSLLVRVGEASAEPRRSGVFSDPGLLNECGLDPLGLTELAGAQGELLFPLLTEELVAPTPSMELSYLVLELEGDIEGDGDSLGRYSRGLPTKAEPVLDRFPRIKSDPGVRICALTGLGGLEVDVWVETGLLDRSVWGLTVRGLMNCSPIVLGVPLEAECAGEGTSKEGLESSSSSDERDEEDDVSE